MKSVTQVLSAAMLLLGACAASPPGPGAVVRSLYGEPGVALTPEQIRAYFASDLAAALIADSGTPGDVGAINFDYRYDAQEARISNLRLTPGHAVGTARVVADFENFGAPQTVTWNLCQSADGAWRIADAGNGDDIPWTLRNLLDQPADIAC